MAFIITKDGKLAEWAGKRYETDLMALGGFHRLSGQSFEYGQKYQGYAIVEVPDDVWSDLEREPVCHGGRNVFRHTHPQTIYPKEDRALVRENCQACCLEGYTADTESFPKLVNVNGPNVSNWQRDYVQTRRVIPARWRDAFYAFETDDNEPWKIALRRDIATFGVRFSDDPQS